MKERILRSFFFVSLCAVAVLGQDAAKDPDGDKLKAERRAKLIAAVLREADELILPENRALISAKLGAAIWKQDPERGGTCSVMRSPA
jgi:hypothetical protein